ASVDPATGAIVAIYGGEDATKHFTNNADATGAQVGSTFKPFVLAAAMRDGVRDPNKGPTQGPETRTLVSPKSRFSGLNGLKIKKYDGSVWRNEKGEEWLQTNDGHDSVGKAPDYMIDLREAMQWSVNSAFVQLGMDVGLDKVKDAAVDAGVLEDSLTGTTFPSFSIGISDPSAIRMAGAYATFAASGKQNDPFSVTEVDSKDGRVYKHETKTKDAFTAKIADNVSDVLKTVVDKGTGTHAQLPGRDVAGKTGTTDGNKSAWFVGYTPQLSTAISMFRIDDNADTKSRKFLEMYGTGAQKQIHGASFPSEIWHDYMLQALEGQPAKQFPTPEPIGEVVNAAPSPTPSPSVTPSQSSSPTPTESATPSKTPSSAPPSPSESECGFFGCSDNGGQQGGNNGNGGNNGSGGNGGNGGDGGNGGADGGTLPSPTSSETTGEGSDQGSTWGNGGRGGVFGN
ncbi:transglycosylase domain-containing protein, partial [Kitasatospora sp. NPDC018614]